MKTTTAATSTNELPDTGIMSDADRLENMRELLADLRHSIRTQRHLIDVSRELLERS